MEIGIGMGMGQPARSFLPTDLPGASGDLKLWLRADQGTTLSSASVSALSAWTIEGVTRTLNQPDSAGGTNAVLLTEDTSTGYHRAYNAAGNSVAGPVRHRIKAKLGTGTRDLVMRTSGDATPARFNLQTGTVVSTTGCTAAITALGNGWWQLDQDVPSAAGPDIFQVHMHNGVSDVNYTGDGVSSVYLYDPQIIQDRLSQLNDFSGLGNNPTQGTAANQPLWRLEDGYAAFGWPLDAQKTFALPSGFYNTWNGNGIPITTVQLVKRIGTPAAAAGLLSLLGATAIAQLTHGTGNLYADRWQDDGAALNKSSNYSGTMPASWHTAVHVYSGTNASLFVDGVADAGNPHDRDVGTQTFTSAQLDNRFTMQREIAVFNRALTAAEYKAVENGMRRRSGLSSV